MDIKFYLTGNIPHQESPASLETLENITASVEVIALKEIPQTNNLAGRLKNPKVVERQVNVYFPFSNEKDQSPKYVVRDYARAKGDKDVVDGLVFIGRADYTSEELKRTSGSVAA